MSKTYRNSGAYQNRGIDYRGRAAKTATFAVRNPIGAPATPRFKREQVVVGDRTITRIANV